MADVPLNHFDRGKPFYPLVVLYVAQVAGFKDLLVAGAPGVTKTVTLERVSSEDDMEFAEQQLQVLLGPLKLASEVQDEPVEVPTDLIADELFANRDYLMAWLTRAASGLLVLANEVTREEPCRDYGPLWEFLRHCRNAAAHGGSFRFLGDEPRRPAREVSSEVVDRHLRLGPGWRA